MLGKLLLHLGPERILWGTDSIWYGSPQGQIDALRAFTISEPFQEQFGYPFDSRRQLILGGNAARLYNVACAAPKRQLAMGAIVCRPHRQSRVSGSWMG